MDGDDSRSSTPGDGGNQSTAPPAQPGSAGELREDQIQNAVSFLSHPKVRGSPKASKVSFLQQKGLTEAEIDEAFRRVPETPVPALPTTTQQSNSTLSTISNHVAPQQQQHYPQHGAQPLPTQPEIRWSQVALGAGFAAASAYAVKSLVWPFVADKYTTWRGTSSTSIAPYNRNDDADLASSAAGSSSDVNAVADAIRAQTAELASSIEALKALIAGLDRQRPASPEDKVTASEIRQELHTIAASLNEIVASPRPGGVTAAGPSSLALETELSEIKNLLSEYLKTPRSGEHTPPGELSRTTPTPGSYSSAQDRPSSEAPSPIQLGDTNTTAVTTSGNTPNAFNLTTSSTTNPPIISNNTNIKNESGRHPASYMEVLEMLERGETPPGIRDDINDKAPNPEQPPPQSLMKPLPKPWEQRQQEHQDGDGGAGPLVSQNLITEDLIENGGDGDTINNGEDSNGVINLSPVVPDDALQRPGSGVVSISSPSPSPSRTNQPQQQHQLPGSGTNAASPLTAAGSKGATSIFEAATSSQGSPGVIAGRLSPSSNQRKAISGGVGGRGVGVAIPTSLFNEQYNNNATTMADGEENKHDGAVGPGMGGGLRPPRLTTTTPLFPDEGGLGRPTSRGWRPPPIPVPTLSPENTSYPAFGPGSKAGGGASGSGTSGSQSSLGADFAAA
ncbi:hypothetical protein Ndes2526B_g04100 [Nannochloris sp. 'desiccata']|nr:hypothetical protein KSW81_001114 [Chlorella desiccata (nom. nud.)]